MPHESENIRSIFAGEPEEPTRVIGAGLLNKGSLLCIAGPPKTYKSFALATMIVELAAGLPVWEVRNNRKREAVFTVNQPQKVLLLEQEIGRSDLKQRYQGILATLPEPLRETAMDNMQVVSCDYDMLLDRPKGSYIIQEYIDSHPVDVVCLDPWSRFFVKGENDADAMNTILYNLNSIRFPRKLSTIIVHHTPKPSTTAPREGLDMLRGHSMLAGAIDSGVLIQSHARSLGRIKCSFVLRRGAPIPSLYLQVDFTTLRTSFLCWKNDPEARQKAGRQERENDVDEFVTSGVQ